jgi:outer membrane protein OmpA-like peptidoglycan-associated protein
MSDNSLKHHECEEHPEWIFTFADLVMLMMGFFVILWVLKPSMTGAQADAGTEDRNRWEATVASVRESFGYIPDSASADPIDVFMIKKKSGQRDAVEAHRRDGLQGDQDNSMVRPSPDVGVGGAIPFDFRSAALGTQSEERLDELAKVLRGYALVVYIKGHASKDEAVDSDPIALSSSRARVCCDALIKRGISPEGLRLVACGAYEPLRRWTGSSSDYAVNRRVEVELTQHLITDFTEAGSRQPSFQR